MNVIMKEGNCDCKDIPKPNFTQVTTKQTNQFQPPSLTHIYIYKYISVSSYSLTPTCTTTHTTPPFLSIPLISLPYVLQETPSPTSFPLYTPSALYLLFPYHPPPSSLSSYPPLPMLPVIMTLIVALLGQLQPIIVQLLLQRPKLAAILHFKVSPDHSLVFFPLLLRKQQR